MALYSAFELLQSISDILDDGYACCEINLIPADDSDSEDSESLSLSVPLDDFASIDYSGVDSHSDDFFNSPLKVNSRSAVCTFSLSELDIIKGGLLNAIQFGNEELSKPGLDRDTISYIKSASVKYRNILAKIEKIFANFQ